MVGSGSLGEVHQFLENGTPRVVMTHLNKWVVTHPLNKYLTPCQQVSWSMSPYDVLSHKAQCCPHAALPFLDGGSCLMLFKYTALSFNH